MSTPVLQRDTIAAAEQRTPLLALFTMYALWIVITATAFPVGRALGLSRIPARIPGPILPTFRMTLMLAVTIAYTRWGERRRFLDAFHLSFRNVLRNVLWALVFFLVATAAVALYERLVVQPLLSATVGASSAEHEPLQPLLDRLMSYLYVLYEGIVEVLIFIGFLLDRLARRWGWARALVVTNIGFALWHYAYFRQGWLLGGLMVLLTFIAGTVISMSYLKTRNSLAPALCHTLVDFPSEIRTLLGLG